MEASKLLDRAPGIQARADELRHATCRRDPMDA